MGLATSAKVLSISSEHLGVAMLSECEALKAATTRIDRLIQQLLGHAKGAA